MVAIVVLLSHNCHCENFSMVVKDSKAVLLCLDKMRNLDCMLDGLFITLSINEVESYFFSMIYLEN